MIKFKTDSETIYNNFVVFFKKSAKKKLNRLSRDSHFFFLLIIACKTVSFDFSHWLSLIASDIGQKKNWLSRDSRFLIFFADLKKTSKLL